MGDPTGNVVPLPLDETKPDGAVIQVRQLDDYQREARLTLKTFLERSLVAFADPKAGEMKPGTAVPIGDTKVHLNNAGTYVPADWENRLAIATDGREFFFWRDLGGGIEIHRVQHIAATQGQTYEKAFTAVPQLLPALAWEEIGAPMTVTLTGFSRRDTGGYVRASIKAAVPVYNAAGADRGLTIRLKYDIGAGFVTTNLDPGNAGKLSLYDSVSLRSNSGCTLRAEAELHSIQLPPAGKLDVRVEVWADGGDCWACRDVVAGQAEEAGVFVFCNWQPL